ncbi:HDOD domain-containing protein [Rhodopirellula sp. MGV]|uniref:HDOD domain-containing protein n=1 Tax=Rhodopirellula sp. MGV TaxID=2023130 RepID=UPI000B974E9A|nr:HDOD domain-containing protein [Rhodopirellula sp. MGV]OYP31702.1 hypothetical protein CGZ80_20620 [Rhodopirellula sp. MGV]PNY34003.1 HDOD domain-containing protein [Rhodopirellula baltica]
MDPTLHIETPPKSLQALLEGRRGETLSLPSAACEALEIAQDPECRPQHLACVISRDPMLAADTLALANSPVFAGGKTLTSLHRAITRLGIRQCKNLIIASSTAGMMKRLPIEQIWVRELLLRHSFATATVAVYLGEFLDLGFDGEEFTAGLLHDLGRLIFALVDPDRFQLADPLNFQESQQTLQREREIFQTDHCHLGAWFANRQRLPHALTESILFHHTPSSECNHQKLVAITSAADHLANHLQRSGESMSYDPEGNLGIKMLEEVVNRPLLESFTEITEPILERTQADLEVSCKDLCESDSRCSE